MFNFLTSKPNAVGHDIKTTKTAVVPFLRRSSTLLLAGSLLLSGCQQQSPATPADGQRQTTEQQRAEADKPVSISDSAKAHITKFQPLYTEQMQGLQRRLQAEYQALQAADAPNDSKEAALATDKGINTDAANTDAANTDADTNAEVEINISTEVGERDLEVLKRISLEPREPILLTDIQITEYYQQALQALYQPAATALSAQETDTLLNIATLLPQVFEQVELAERLSIKSPALARFIVQHQVWQQIEIQQARDMQQMKLAQQQEFESLMSKFNETIAGYDEQIAQYEQTLKEFR
jgi:hypothetical protein